MAHFMENEKYLPEPVKRRNQELVEAYNKLLVTVQKIQGWFYEEMIRTRIESDFRNKEGVRSAIFQCTTPFCMISVGCDERGEYNMVYSLDHRIKKMIGPDFTATLIRRIHDYTGGMLQSYVLVGNLNEDCLAFYYPLVEASSKYDYHKVIIQGIHNN